MSSNWQPQLPFEDIKAGPIEGGPDGVKGSENEAHGGPRKKVVVVGLGMVGISFMWVPIHFPLLLSAAQASKQKMALGHGN